MNETTISVTEAARNFADCVNRSHYQNTTFLLLKNGVPFARLSPATAPVCTGRQLAAAVAKFKLTDEESQAWQQDLRAARKKLKPPRDRWE